MLFNIAIHKIMLAADAGFGIIQRNDVAILADKEIIIHQRFRNIEVMLCENHLSFLLLPAVARLRIR